MLDNLGIAIASICLLIGAVLVDVAVTKPDTNQNLTVLGGAALLSLGLLSICLALKNKWARRQNHKKYRAE